MAPRSSDASPAPVARSHAAPVWWGALVLVVLGALAFGNGVGGALVFDDIPSIKENAALERVWPPWASVPSMRETTFLGRPVAQFSFALNRRLTGTDPVGYHAGNILIHMGAGLVLFGIARRTLRRAMFPAKVREAATEIALAMAAMWLVHPLQTESVTYLVQRVESLMGWWYLLTLYAFIRAVEPGAKRWWQGLAVLACLLGMGTKEVMVSAPLAVLLYDRAFVAGTLRGAWQQRKWLYLGLAATWVALAVLVWSAHNRGGSAGFGAGVSAWNYGLTQFRAIAMYLRLAVWPDPLVFYYGNGLVRGLGEVAWAAVAVVALGAGVAVALARNRAVGWLGFCFFAILAPSSSVVPIAAQSMAEHRMYLSLAAVVALVVYGGFRWLGRWSAAGWIVAVAALSFATVARNRVYRSEIAVWTDTVAKAPGGRAYDALGNVLDAAGRTEEAAEAFRNAVAVQPDYVDSYNNLAAMLDRQGDRNGARQALEQALAIEPKHIAANFNLAELLRKEGDLAGAKAHYLAVIRGAPGEPTPWLNLAAVETELGEAAEAIGHWREGLKRKPDDAAAWMNLGILLAGRGEGAEAIAAFEAAVRVAPESGQAHYDLGCALTQARRLPEAVAEYERAVALEPAMVNARLNLALALTELKRYAEAAAQYEAILRIEPGNATAQANLAAVRVRAEFGR